MYDVGLRKPVEKAFFKLARKNPRQLEVICKKVEEIRKDPHRFKNLRSPLQNLKRVHIDKSHVLLYSIMESKNRIVIEAYEHHDRIYER